MRHEFHGGHPAREDYGPGSEAMVLTSYNYSRSAAGNAPRSLIPPEPAPYSHSRYSDQPMGWRTRAIGMGGTASVGLMIMLCLFVTWRVVHPVVAPPTLAVFDVSPPAAPPEPDVAVPEGPVQVEQAEQKPQVQEQPEPPEIIIPRLSPIAAAKPPPIEQAAAADPVLETTAPKSLVAPIAPRASDNAEMTWEGLLMAHLEKHRRYPAAARARREQGTVYVRFRMNRAGQVLWLRIDQSSGSTTLDRAALDTFRRAQPLPAIPDDKADELEIALPVEFFTRR